VLILSALAFAEEPVFVGTEEGVEVPKAETKLVAELGGAASAGNVDFFVLSGSLDGERAWGNHRVKLDAGGIAGRARLDADGDGVLSDDERTEPRVENARRIFSDLRYDRFLGEKNSLYILGGAFADRYAGYDWRTHEQFGYSRRLLHNETTDVVGEIGLDFAQENFVDGIDPNSANVLAGRARVGVSHTFNDSVKLSDELEVYENLLDRQDLRVLNTAAVTMRLSDAMSLKFSHTLIFDNVPVEGFRKADQTATISLVATLL
jgi:putative salt-induced outer membrane protein YdiY